MGIGLVTVFLLGNGHPYGSKRLLTFLFFFFGLELGGLCVSFMAVLLADELGLVWGFGISGSDFKVAPATVEALLATNSKYLEGLGVGSRRFGSVTIKRLVFLFLGVKSSTIISRILWRAKGLGLGKGSGWLHGTKQP
ncbi:hypothetical protein PanWU01x14_334610 [Parasponia andersonii]|uniref:Uncharacterized protein n=1 Tax=Parasponia andersonii TaxID=3476 RepID=A0A2P5AGG1_PARAD|nr:hypothetical protein PanWU01x14_334610 [Parasponia andersonii]